MARYQGTPERGGSPATGTVPCPRSLSGDVCAEGAGVDAPERGLVEAPGCGAPDPHATVSRRAAQRVASRRGRTPMPDRMLPPLPVRVLTPMLRHDHGVRWIGHAG